MGFELVTSATPVRCSTNWAVKPHVGSEVNLFISYLPVQWNDVKYIWNSCIKFTAIIILHFHLQPQYNMNFICISHDCIYFLIWLLRWLSLGLSKHQSLGSLSNHDDDGQWQERHKFAYVTKRNSTLHVHFSFLYISQSFLFFRRHEMTCFAVVWTTWAAGAGSNLISG